MKTLKVAERVHGRSAEVAAKSTYQTASGKWIAEVDGAEFLRACLEVCHGVSDCRCEDLRVEADQDDDGKEYGILSMYPGYGLSLPSIKSSKQDGASPELRCRKY